MFYFVDQTTLCALSRLKLGKVSSLVFIVDCCGLCGVMIIAASLQSLRGLWQLAAHYLAGMVVIRRRHYYCLGERSN
jgi:hypothetical protein